MCGVCMFMHRGTLDYLLQLYVMLRRPHKTVQYNAGLEYGVVVAKKDMKYVFRNLSTAILIY